jgi:hypothetical protein
MIRDAEKYIALREDKLPEISSTYSLTQIEKENKVWWPTHCMERIKHPSEGNSLAGARQ